MIAILDLGIGNLHSVANAFHRIGVATNIVQTPAEAEDNDIVVLPGVGAFERAMTPLRARGFEPFLRQYVTERPLIGICLGMQLLGDRSLEHGETAGLGLIAGTVSRLEPRPPDYLVPNIGWTTVHAAKPSVMFPPGVDGQSFYHVHSYHLVCDDPSDVAATIDFGDQRIVTAVERGNVFGVQFHPEKSQDAGLGVIDALMSHLNEQRVGPS